MVNQDTCTPTDSSREGNKDEPGTHKPWFVYPLLAGAVSSLIIIRGYYFLLSTFLGCKYARNDFSKRPHPILHLRTRRTTHSSNLGFQADCTLQFLSSVLELELAWWTITFSVSIGLFRQKPMWLSQPPDFCFFCQFVAFTQPPNFLFEAKLATGSLPYHDCALN
jgi:hypothetical protein